MADTKITGTKEWAESNVNIQDGCKNDCRYCYAKAMAVRFGRTAPESWKNPVIRAAEVDKNYRLRKGTLMFPSTHDITPDNIGECLAVLRKLLEAGNRVLIVSKPVPACIESICRELADYREQILFRFTIGSADNRVLRFWEPNAPTFKERLKSLAIAREHDFQTSVSCEPMLDNCIETVVEAVLPLVTDAIWIGVPNRLGAIISVTGGDDSLKAAAKALEAGFTKERVMELYGLYMNNPKIKWKDSIKKIAGLARPEEAGLDI